MTAAPTVLVQDTRVSASRSVSPQPKSPAGASGCDSIPSTPFGRLLAWDQRVSQCCFEWYGNCDSLPESLLIALEASGHGLIWVVWPVLLALARPSMSLPHFSNHIHFYFVALLDLVVIGILKPLFRRQRPSYNGGLQAGTIEAIDQYSFPSGHATRSVSVAAYVFYVAFKRPGTLLGWMESTLFLACTLLWGVACAVSRVALGRHHVLDVLCGAIVGVLYVVLVDAVWLSDATVLQFRNLLKAHGFLL